MRRRRANARRIVALRVLVALGALTATATLVGLVFAGSPGRLAGGMTVAGVDVGGMTQAQARTLLERRFADVEDVPVSATAGDRAWEIRPSELGVAPDWRAALREARRAGDGLAPVRGYRRLAARLVGANFEPPVRLLEGTLAYRMRRIAAAVDRPHRDAALRFRGLEPVVVAPATGVMLDRERAAGTLRAALGAFERKRVMLPVRVVRPSVTVRDLIPASRLAAVAVSAPVRLTHGTTRWRLPRWRIRELVVMPKNGATTLRIGGPGADRYFERLERLVSRPARDATFSVDGSTVRVIPGQPGLAVDVPSTSAALLRAATAASPALRNAALAVDLKQPERTTAEANAMGITGLVGSYETIYGGEPNRIHNVQLVARLIDGTLIKPGATFSFNETTGERTAEKGFLEAPVIINGELQTGLGGGVCQVSTTVFNAAYEAGLGITSRTNHALYISHYPLGRDATVNYPDLDLRFVNDTGRWLLLRTFVGSSSLVVNLYGTPTERRVETHTSPLRVTGGPPLRRLRDPSLPAGKTVVLDSGEPSRATSVRRVVYRPDGAVLHEDTWSSYYRSEPRIVRVGTKRKPEAKAAKKAAVPLDAALPGSADRSAPAGSATAPEEPAAEPPASPLP